MLLSTKQVVDIFHVKSAAADSDSDERNTETSWLQRKLLEINTKGYIQLMDMYKTSCPKRSVCQAWG